MGDPTILIKQFLDSTLTPTNSLTEPSHSSLATTTEIPFTSSPDPNSTLNRDDQQKHVDWDQLQVYNMLITSLFLLFVLTTVSLLIFLLMRRPPCCGPCRDSYQDAHTPSQANGNSSAVPVTYMTESHGIVVKKKILDSPPPYESPPDYQSLAPELIMDAKTLLQLAAASSSSSSSPVASIPPSASATPPPTAAVTPCLSRLHHTADVTTITNTTQETSFLDSNPEERCVVPSEPTRHHQALLPPPTYESVVYIPEDGNRPMAYQTKDHIPSDSVVTKSEMMTTIVACDVLTEPPQQQHVEHS